MLSRNCVLSLIATDAEGRHRYRCQVCGREATSKFPADQVHLMCRGTLEEIAAWRESARLRFLDYLDGAIELAEEHGLSCRSYDEARTLYAQCENCPDWQVTLCRRLKCPARPQKYLRILTEPGQGCPVWTLTRTDGLK